MVQEYVSKNKIEGTRFNNNRPGYKWMKNFLKRNRLTMKKAEMISTARMANTSNPFIIYDFYDTLERASTLLSLSEAYLEPCRTFKMGPFAKMINGFQSLNIFAKKLPLRRWTRLWIRHWIWLQWTRRMIVTTPLKYTSTVVIDAFIFR